MSGRVEYRGLTVTYDCIVDDLITPATVLPPAAEDRAAGTEPLEVMALWDTGATGSCIKPRLKDRLNLSLDANNTVRLSGIGGEVQVFMALVNIRLIPNAEIVSHPVSIVDFPGDADILIGMDIIGMGDFAVCNAEEKTSFSFAMPPFPDRINLAEKADAINKQVK
jgi:hypothetical protein